MASLITHYYSLMFWDLNSFQEQKSLNLHVKLFWPIFYWEEMVSEILASYRRFLRVLLQGGLVNQSLKEVFTLQN